MKTFKRAFAITFLFGLILTAAFGSGYLLHVYQLRTAASYPIMDEAYSLLNEFGYTPLPTPPALEYGMIRGMLQAYGDPYSSFLEPPQAELENQTLQGSFGGIGVELGRDAEGYPVMYPFPDGPAAKAGVIEGDRLVGADKLEVTPQTNQEAIIAAVRGPVGSYVTIRVSRPPDDTPFEFRIQRQEIAIPSVTWHLEPTEARLGVLQVNVIAATTPSEIVKAVADLKSRGATVFALDLRNNGGGLLDSGIEVARLFLKEGIVIQQQYRGKEVETMKVNQPGSLADLPLVVLVNQGTASAAEIIAGSLQANGRAPLIGANTYGKDTIQLVFELSDRSSLHVTTARWWLPGSEAKPITGRGLTPDIEIPPDAAPEPDPFITAAIHTLLTP